MSAKLNQYRRYQTHLNVEDIFPVRDDKLCACGCGAGLPPRKRRWASKECESKALALFFVVKGDSKEIRKQLFERDNGVCANCGIQSEWDADHILPVHQGGGACDLDNFQTLCIPCHKIKTSTDGSKRQHHAQEAPNPNA